MASNLWTFSGTVLKFNARQGSKGGAPAPWGKMWIRIALDNIKKHDQTLIDNNVIFLNLALDYDPKSKKHKATSKLLDTIKEGSFISVREAKIDKIKRSRKDDEGNWEDYYEIGIRANPNQVGISSNRLAPFNTGLVAGKVSQQQGTSIFVEESYMVPGDKVEWKTREIPLVLPNNTVIKGKNIVAVAKLSAIGPSGQEVVCGYVQDFLVEP
jgi:hypothetical protein